MNKIAILLSVAISHFVYAGPPEPPTGFRWILNTAYSDEFNGVALDKTKWRDSFNGWVGRPPAKFDASTISLSGGNLIIRNAPLVPAQGIYTIKGGAIQSLNQTASYGYYECSFKASRIAMSTTFWMSNDKYNLIGVNKMSGGIDCPKDQFSQELDIAESVGGVFNGSFKFRTDMNFNTHFRYVNCNGDPEIFYSAGNNAIERNGAAANSKLSSESWQDFHTYGCYWKSATQCDFYSDANFAGTVKMRTNVVDNPFLFPMGINMVTETYDWARPVPTDAQLNDNTINASYYDWVRSYTLVPINQTASATGLPFIYTENVSFSNFVGSMISSKTLDFTLLYQANADRDIHIIIKDSKANIISDSPIFAYAGYGKNVITVSLANAIPAGTYTVTTELRPKDGGAGTQLSTVTKTLTITGTISGLESSDETVSYLAVFPNPANTEIHISQEIESWKIFNLQGVECLSGKASTISVDGLPSGTYQFVSDKGSRSFVKK